MDFIQTGLVMGALRETYESVVLDILPKCIRLASIQTFTLVPVRLGIDMPYDSISHPQGHCVL